MRAGLPSRRGAQWVSPSAGGSPQRGAIDLTRATSSSSLCRAPAADTPRALLRLDAHPKFLNNEISEVDDTWSEMTCSLPGESGRKDEKTTRKAGAEKKERRTTPTDHTRDTHTTEIEPGDEPGEGRGGGGLMANGNFFGRGGVVLSSLNENYDSLIRIRKHKAKAHRN